MWIYNLVVRAYGLLIRLSSLRNEKAAQWVRGRRDWREHLVERAPVRGRGRLVWVHCASYGEFEQGRPLIEAIRNKFPDHRVVLSFFSPSGYQAFHNWKGADMVCYLPLDTKRNAGDFLELIKPDVAIFVKYEFWVNFLFRLKELQIPTYLVSAVFKPHHPFFKWYGGLFRQSLHTFTRLFVQDENSGALLQGIGITNFEVSGDTRFDRVLKIKEGDCGNPVLAAFKGNSKLIVAGSTWPGDEDLLIESLAKFKDRDVKLVLAPHEIEQNLLAASMQKLAAKGITYTLYHGNEAPSSQARVLILNTIGVLSKSYFYADCAYVGGGFNSGLHNILEPTVFQIPVAFYGEKFEKYNEAVDLLQLGAAANVRSSDDLVNAFEKHLFDTGFTRQVGSRLAAYFSANANASEKILAAIDL